MRFLLIFFLLFQHFLQIHFLESLLPFKGRITANNKEIITSLLGLFIDDEDGWVSSFSSLVFVKLFGDTDHPFSESISQLQFNLQQFLDEKLERVVRDPYFQVLMSAYFSQLCYVCC